MKHLPLTYSIHLAILATILFFASPVHAEEVQLMLTERNPWLMVIGSDSPTFVLYKSRRAIWWEGSKEDGQYVTASLSEQQVHDLLSVSRNLSTIDEYISLSDWTDQTTQEFSYWRDDELVRRAVYGSLRPTKKSGLDTKERSSAPVQVLEIFDKLTGFTDPAAKPWVPSFLEVMIWPYEYAPDKSIFWPEYWPDIDSPTTRHRGDSHSLYVPYSEKSKLYEFFDTRNTKGAVVINDSKWAVSVRLPFPHELEF